MCPVNPYGTRLITNNLLLSADVIQSRSTVNANHLADLCQLIDIYCLCDQVTLLGQQMMTELAQASSSLMKLLADSKFVVSADTHEERAIISASRRHLMAYLGENAGSDYDSLLLKALRISCHGLSKGYDSFPNEIDGADGVSDFDIGRKIFMQGGGRTLFFDDSSARGFKFFVRSFVYLGFSDVSGLVFAPDSTRVPIIGKIIESEQDLRVRMLDAMKSGYEKRPSSMARHISPLAAVVFERAKPDPEHIPQEMAKLREELQPLRVRLRKAERILDEGKGDKVAESLYDWNLVIGEIQTSFGLEPTLVSLEKILNFGRAMGELRDEPTSAKSWIGFLLGLPFEVVRRVIARGPAIELHHIRKDLPASRRLREAVKDLFGSEALS